MNPKCPDSEARRNGLPLKPKPCWLTTLFCRTAIFSSFLSAPVMALAAGGSATSESAGSLADLSIQQLMNEPVTSVSKKEEKLTDAAAAIFVISSDDIRRLGITSIPEALRLVPGLDVARINSHEWAISSRGFNVQFANKLLVLVDGRSVYGTGFGGVVWGVQDVVMEDVDRIEVIRGPGGTLWGANAMNGVINIITKSAKETQGTLISTTVGTEDHPTTTVRFGDQIGTNLFYRAYVKYFDRDGLVEADGQDAPDDWNGTQGGMRMDWEPTEINHLTLQGDAYYNRITENQDVPSLLPPYSQNVNNIDHNSGANVLGRWAHSFSESSMLTLQAYYDHFKQEQIQATEVADTVDIDAQHQFALGEYNSIMWGLGYRHLADQFSPGFFVSWNPAQHEEQLYSTFVQDEVTLLPDRFKVTVGSKFEHNDYTGFEIQPSARLLWTPTEKQTLWAAVSRAVRTPSRSDLNQRVNLQVFPPSPPNPLPVLVSSFGNPNLGSEVLIAYELGYRIELTRQCSLDLAGFFNDYDNLIAPVVGTPGFEASPAPPHILIPSTYDNIGRAQTYGIELSGRWNVTGNWHVTANYTWFDVRAGANPPLVQSSPEQQVQLTSAVDLPGNLEWNTAVYYVDQIESPNILGQTHIPAYLRLDMGLVWHPTKYLEIGLWGQNLLQDRHAEFASYKTSIITEIPRSVMGTISLRF